MRHQDYVLTDQLLDAAVSLITNGGKIGETKYRRIFLAMMIDLRNTVARNSKRIFDLEEDKKEKDRLILGNPVFHPKRWHIVAGLLFLTLWTFVSNLIYTQGGTLTVKDTIDSILKIFGIA